MDATFIEGAGATLAAIIVFCGSVFLLLTFLMGAKLAYYITASVTLAFLLIMGLIWSTNELGPVGELPEWVPVSAAEEGEALEGPSASEYPEGPWQPVDQNDEEALNEATELQTGAVEYVSDEATAGNLPQDATAFTATADTVRFLDQGDARYGAVTLEPPANEEGTPIVVVMEFDPGNPLGQARQITLVTFLLLVAHLFFLSRAERAARRKREETALP